MLADQLTPLLKNLPGNENGLPTIMSYRIMQSQLSLVGHITGKLISLLVAEFLDTL
jgi:hypothetical protein